MHEHKTDLAQVNYWAFIQKKKRKKKKKKKKEEEEKKKKKEEKEKETSLRVGPDLQHLVSTDNTRCPEIQDFQIPRTLLYWFCGCLTAGYNRNFSLLFFILVNDPQGQ